MEPLCMDVIAADMRAHPSKDVHTKGRAHAGVVLGI